MFGDCVVSRGQEQLNCDRVASLTVLEIRPNMKHKVGKQHLRAARQWTRRTDQRRNWWLFPCYLCDMPCPLPEAWACSRFQLKAVFLGQTGSNVERHEHGDQRTARGASRCFQLGIARQGRSLQWRSPRHSSKTSLPERVCVGDQPARPGYATGAEPRLPLINLFWAAQFVCRPLHPPR